MTIKKKVGIVTWFGSNNYGTNLQAYALYAVVREFGYVPYLIRPFLYRRKFHQFPGQSQSFLSTLKNFILITLGLASAERMRQHKIMRFLIHNFQFSSVVHNQKEAQNLENEFDCFLTGSDQIWNPYFLDTFYFLDFVKDRNKKVAYSSSIAVDSIPAEKVELYQRYLLSFKALSCREASGASLLQRTIDKPVKAVIDPVLLLAPQEWRTFSLQASLKKKIGVDKPYIFCYFIGNNPAYWEWVDEIRKATHIDTIYVLGVAPYPIPVDKAIPLWTAEISDFVWFLDHAQYVCTDSFHNMAMGLKLHKPFSAFMRCKDNDVRTENSRVYDFLKHYHLDDRIYVTNKANLNQPIDFDTTDSILACDIDDCKKYIKSNIG